MSKNKYTFVQKEVIAQQPPPLTQAGITGWLWKNLFSSMSNFSSLSSSIQSLVMIVLTLLLLYFCGGQFYNLIDFAILSAVWSDPDTLKRDVCNTVDQGGQLPSGWKGACWPFIFAKKKLLIYGRYPADELWRVNTVYIVLLLGIGYTLFEGAKGRQWTGMAMLTIFPLFALILLTGANFNIGWDTLLLQLGISILLILLGETSRRNLFGKILFELNALFYILGVTLFLIFIASFLLSINYGMSYVETSDWGGLLVTLVVAITGIVASLPLGIILALGRRSNMPIARTISTIFIEFWRGIPLITVLFAASVLLPLFLPDGVDFNKLLRALIGVMLFSAAYMAEVVRGGLQAIPRGQFEGASAVGLSYSQSMRLIILPQALTHVIPGIVNTFIGLFKDTTLVLIIGLFDLLGQAQSTIADLYWSSPTQAPSAYLAVGLLFFVFCFGMSRYSMFMERKLSRDHKE